MKKEKVILTDEEKMKNSFKTYGSISELIESILIVAPTMLLIIFLLLGVATFFENKNNAKTDNIVAQTTQSEENTLKEFIIDLISDDGTKIDDISNFEITMKIISFVADYVFSIIILHNLTKMFKDISQDAKPFTESNVKRINIISWSALGLWITTNSNIGLITVICIFAISKIFKSGYKLQIESDETL